MKNLKQVSLVGLAAFASVLSTLAYSVDTEPSQVPLFLTAAAPPAVLLNMGRDHKLYYEAYNDASDINGDGLIDVGYKPATITYFGIFDSFKCYTYAAGVFTPAQTTTNKKCTAQWSGDFLNYITTTRIDALRRVLYGGMRSTDSATETVLERAFIPQDAHSFGKEYRNPNLGTSATPIYNAPIVNGYAITDYTPLAAPATGTSILFASTTLDGTTAPLLRVMTGRNNRIWEWVSIERPVAGSRVLHGGSGPDVSANIVNYTVRVKVCVIGLLEQDCRGYTTDGSTVYKPTGVLHEFGEKGQMRFGLMSGSYDKNFSGGVLRKNIGNFADEVNPADGTFTSNAAIVKTINAFRVQGWGSSYAYTCGWYTSGTSDSATGGSICSDWGNPVAEMMYEGLRYLAGKTTPTGAYYATTATKDTALGLPRATWIDPFTSNNLPYCSKPVQMVISDIYASFDSDEIPGTAFGSGIPEDLGGRSLSGNVTFSAQSVANVIWTGEGLASGQYFIGQSGSVADSAVTPKAVSGFGDIRGLAPEEPTKRGSYYAASVAHYGKTTDLRPNLKGVQNVDTYSIALASPLPKIQIPVLDDKFVTIIPYGKSVAGLGINAAVTSYQPANQIVDFYIDQIWNQAGFPTNAAINGGRPYGKFRINFEDVEQGADHDMDAIVEYEYSLTSSGSISVTLTSTYAAGGIVQHMGYVISGTTADGLYLEVRDLDTAAASDLNYYLDTKAATYTAAGLPLTATRTFTPNSTGVGAKFIPHDPLWYAAKWGGFPDSRDSATNEVILQAAGTIPAAGSASTNPQKWDKRKTGEPDNYFLVSDAAVLRQQLRRAFLDIQQSAGAAAGVATGSTGLTAESWSYLATFNSADWSGEITGSPISVFGEIGAPVWTTADTFKFPGSSWSTRPILTWTPSTAVGAAGNVGSANNFSFTGALPIPSSQLTSLNLNNLALTLKVIPSLNWTSLTAIQQQTKALEVLVNYLKGDHSLEKAQGGNLRDRKTVIGDIVNSNVATIGSFNYGFKSLPGAEGSSYQSWLESKRTNASTYKTIFVGSNNGMLHAINATTGEERFSYVPNGVYGKLHKLLESGYPHEYMVDGKIAVSDVYRSGAWTTVLVGSTGAGGRSIFALDVGNPNGDVSNVLWEFKSPDLGFSLGKPIITRTAGATGKWVAIFTNGYFSDSGKAKIFVLDLFTGAEIANFEAPALASGVAKNGLGAPGAYIEEGIVRSVFAGDLNGRLWGLNAPATVTGSWTTVGGSDPVFIAQDSSGVAQPITASPSVSSFIGGGVQIFFGTGKLIVQSDRAVDQHQSFYALRVKSPTAWVGAKTRTNLQAIPLSETGNARYLSKVSFTGAKFGWYYNLPTPTTGQGAERFVSEAKYGLGFVDVNTWLPLEDQCAVGGQSWGMTMNALTGYVGQALFDLNDDGYIDTWEGKQSDNTYTAGVRLSTGTVSSPSINLTQGASLSGSSSRFVSDSEACKAGEVSVNNPEKAGTKICRPDKAGSNKKCETNDLVVTNAGATGGGSAKGRCRPVSPGRQSWIQLR